MATMGSLLQMERFIIRFLVLPQFPNDANPAISESAISMTLFETALASGGVKSSGPRRLFAGAASKLLSKITKVVIASSAEMNGSDFATLFGDRTGSRQRLKAHGRGKRFLSSPNLTRRLGAKAGQHQVKKQRYADPDVAEKVTVTGQGSLVHSAVQTKTFSQLKSFSLIRWHKCRS
ncbi:hypothetical protein KFU94_46570 [Chloroflexi bacterium TSY]|nr:hypothetical protein [Chloroflexi bacterium TSY]